MIHSFGYSYSDLKPENIVARLFSKCPDHGKGINPASIKFSLIDLGMSSKMADFGRNQQNKSFRGNYMFASCEKFINGRSRTIDDVYSLMCSAFYFIYQTLPWLDQIRNSQKKGLNHKLYEFKVFKNLRLQYSSRHDQQLVKGSGELSDLFKYVIQR